MRDCFSGDSKMSDYKIRYGATEEAMEKIKSIVNSKEVLNEIAEIIDDAIVDYIDCTRDSRRDS